MKPEHLAFEVIESYNEAANKLKPELPIIAFASVSVSLLHHILGIVFWKPLHLLCLYHGTRGRQLANLRPAHSFGA